MKPVDGVLSAGTLVLVDGPPMAPASLLLAHESILRFVPVQKDRLPDSSLASMMGASSDECEAKTYARKRYISGPLGCCRLFELGW